MKKVSTPQNYDLAVLWTSLVAQTVKRLPTMWETWVQSLGQEDLLEKEMANPLQYSYLENSMGREAIVGCQESGMI